MSLSQVSYLGFCGTLGADYMQYMIADETLVPPESRRFYTEKMMYMPHSYFVNDHKQARINNKKKKTKKSKEKIQPERNERSEEEEKKVYVSYW